MTEDERAERIELLELAAGNVSAAHDALRDIDTKRIAAMRAALKRMEARLDREVERTRFGRASKGVAR